MGSAAAVVSAAAAVESFPPTTGRGVFAPWMLEQGSSLWTVPTPWVVVNCNRFSGLCTFFNTETKQGQRNPPVGAISLVPAAADTPAVIVNAAAAFSVHSCWEKLLSKTVFSVVCFENSIFNNIF